jgi:hypothetical protein
MCLVKWIEGDFAIAIFGVHWKRKLLWTTDSRRLPVCARPLGVAAQTRTNPIPWKLRKCEGYHHICGHDCYVLLPTLTLVAHWIGQDIAI